VRRLISLTVFITGVILVAYGIAAAQSPVSDLSRLFTSTPTDKTVWLLIKGTVAAIVGAAGLLAETKPV